MGEMIKEGDLVMCVRACCAQTEIYIGRVFLALAAPNIRGVCSGCNKQSIGPYFASRPNATRGYDVWRLKRIPPLDQLEGKKETADLGEAMRKLRKELTS